MDAGAVATCYCCGRKFNPHEEGEWKDGGYICGGCLEVSVEERKTRKLKRVRRGMRREDPPQIILASEAGDTLDRIAEETRETLRQLAHMYSVSYEFVVAEFKRRI